MDLSLQCENRGILRSFMAQSSRGNRDVRLPQVMRGKLWRGVIAPVVAGTRDGAVDVGEITGCHQLRNQTGHRVGQIDLSATYRHISALSNSNLKVLWSKPMRTSLGFPQDNPAGPTLGVVLVYLKA